jgi:hypothetical protein
MQRERDWIYGAGASSADNAEDKERENWLVKRKEMNKEGLGEEALGVPL